MRLWVCNFYLFIIKWISVHLLLLVKLTLSAGLRISVVFFHFSCIDWIQAVTPQEYSPTSSFVVCRRRSLNVYGSTRVTVISPASTRLAYDFPGTRVPFSSSDATVPPVKGSCPSLNNQDTPRRPLWRLDTFKTLHSRSVGSPENFAVKVELRTTVKSGSARKRRNM